MYAAFYKPETGVIQQRGSGSTEALKGTADHLGLSWLAINREQYGLPLETTATVQNGALVMDPTDG